MKQNSKVIVLAESPESEITDEELKNRAELVKDIIKRGKTAVFERPHRILSDVTVTREVSEWKPSIDSTSGEYDLEADNGLYVALWDAAYTITEK